MAKWDNFYKHQMENPYKNPQNQQKMNFGNPTMQQQQFGNPFAMQEDYMSATSHLIPTKEEPEWRRSSTGIDRFFNNLLEDPTFNYNPNKTMFSPTSRIVESYGKRREAEVKLQNKYGLSDSDMGILRWQVNNMDKWRSNNFQMSINDMNTAMESYQMDNMAFNNLLTNQGYYDSKPETDPYYNATNSYMNDMQDLSMDELDAWYGRLSDQTKYQLKVAGFEDINDIKTMLNSRELNDALQNNDVEKAESVLGRGVKTGVGAVVATKIAAALVAIPEPITSGIGLAILGGTAAVAGMGLEKAEQEEVGFFEDLSHAEKNFRNAMFNVLFGQVAGSIDFAGTLTAMITTPAYNFVTGKDSSLEDNWINKGFNVLASLPEGINQMLQSDVKDMQYNKFYEQFFYEGLPQVMGSVVGFSGFGVLGGKLGLGGPASAKMAALSKDKGSFVSGILNASKAEVIMRTMRSMSEGNDVYNNAINAGASDLDASIAALGSMTTNFGLLTVTGALPGKGVRATTSELGNASKGLELVKGLTMDALYEVGEEVSQLLISDAANYYTGAQEEWSSMEAYLQSAFYGAIGGTMGGGMEYFNYKDASYKTLDAVKAKVPENAPLIDKKFNKFKEQGYSNFKATDETLAWIAEKGIDNTTAETLFREMLFEHKRNFMEGYVAFQDYFTETKATAKEQLGSKATDEEIEAKAWKIINDEYSDQTRLNLETDEGKKDTIKKSDLKNHNNTLEALDNGYNPSNESQKIQNNVVRDIKSDVNPEGTFEMQRAVELSNVKSTLGDDRNTYVDTFRAMKDNNITLENIVDWQSQTDNSYVDSDHLRTAREHVATMKKTVNDMIDNPKGKAKAWAEKNELEGKDFDYMRDTNVITDDELVDILRKLDMKSTDKDINTTIDYINDVDNMYNQFRSDIRKDKDNAWENAKKNYDLWQDKITNDFDSYTDYSNYMHRIGKHINQEALNFMNKFEEMYTKQLTDTQKQEFEERGQKIEEYKVQEQEYETKIKEADETLKVAKEEIKTAKEESKNIIEEGKKQLKQAEGRMKARAKKFLTEAEKAKQLLTETKPRHEVSDTEYLDSIIDKGKKALAKITKENDRVKKDNVVTKHEVDSKTKQEQKLVDQKDIATKEYSLEGVLSDKVNEQFLKELNHTLEISPQEDFVVGVNPKKNNYMIIPVETREGVSLSDAQRVAKEKLGLDTDIRLVNRKNIHDKVVEANKKINEQTAKQLKEQFTNKELVYRHEANKGYKNSSQQHYDTNTEKKVDAAEKRRVENRIKDNNKRIDEAKKDIGVTTSINATTIDDVLEQANQSRVKEVEHRNNVEVEEKAKMQNRLDELVSQTDTLKAQLEGKSPVVEKKVVEKKVQKQVKKKVPKLEYMQTQAKETEANLNKELKSQVRRIKKVAKEQLAREMKSIKDGKPTDKQQQTIDALNQIQEMDIKRAEDIDYLSNVDNFHTLPKHVTGPIQAAQHEITKEYNQLQEINKQIKEETQEASVPKQIEEINNELNALDEEAYDIGMKVHDMLMAELEKARQHWSQKRMTAKNKDRLASIENFVNELESTKDKYRDDTYTMHSEGGFNTEGLVELLGKLDFGKDAQAILSSFNTAAHNVQTNRLVANQKLDELNARNQTTDDIQKEMDKVSSNKYKSASIVQGEADKLIQKMLNHNLALYQDAKKSMDNLQDFTPEQQKNIRKSLKTSEIVLKKLREFKTDTPQNAYKSIKDSNLFSLDEKGYIGALMNSYDGLVSKEQKLLGKIKDAKQQETKVKEEQYIEVMETIEETIQETIEEVVSEEGVELTDEQKAEINKEITKNYEEFAMVNSRLKNWDKDTERISEDFMLIDEAKRYAKDHAKEELLEFIEGKEKQIDKNAKKIKEKHELVKTLEDDNLVALNENNEQFRKQRRVDAYKKYKKLERTRNDRISRAKSIKETLFEDILGGRQQEADKLQARKKQIEDNMDKELDTTTVIEEKIRDVKALRKEINKDLEKDQKITSKELTMRKGRSKTEPDLFTLETTPEVFEAHKDRLLENADLVKQDGNIYTLRAKKGLTAETLGMNEEYQAITKQLEDVQMPTTMKELFDLVQKDDAFKKVRNRVETDYDTFKTLVEKTNVDRDTMINLHKEMQKWKPLKSKTDQANEQGKQVTKKTLEDGFKEIEGKVYEEVEVTNEEALQTEINRLVEEDFGRTKDKLKEVDAKMKEVEQKRVKQEEQAQEKLQKLEAERIAKQEEVEQKQAENEAKIADLEKEIAEATLKKEQLEAKNEEAILENEIIAEDEQKIKDLIEENQKLAEKEYEEYNEKKKAIEEQMKEEEAIIQEEIANNEKAMQEATEDLDKVLAENANLKYKLAEEQKQDAKISPIVEQVVGKQRKIKRRRRRAQKNINTQELAQESHTTITTPYEAKDVPVRDYGDKKKQYWQNFLNNMSTKKTIQDKTIKETLKELKLDFTKLGVDPVKNATLVSAVQNYNNNQGKNAKQTQVLIDQVFKGLTDEQFLDLNRFLFLRSEFEGFHEHGQGEKFSMTDNMTWGPGEQKHEFVINELQEVQGIIDQDTQLLERIKLWDDTKHELDELLIQMTKEVRGIDRRNDFSRKNYFKNVVIDEMKLYNENKADYIKNGKLKGYVDTFEKHGNTGAIKTNAADLFTLTHFAAKNELTWLELLRDIQTENKKTPVLEELNKNLQGVKKEVEDAILNATDESGFNKVTTMIDRILNNTEIPQQDKAMMLNYLENPINWKSENGKNVLEEIKRIAQDDKIAQTKKLVSLAKDGFFDASRDFHDLVRKLKDGEISFSDLDLRDFANYVYSDHHLVRGKNETKHLIEAFAMQTDLENIITDVGMKHLGQQGRSLLDYIPEGYQLTDEFANPLSQQKIKKMAGVSSPFLTDFKSPEALTKYFLNQVMYEQGQEGYIHQNLKDGQFMILPNDTVKALEHITTKQEVKNKFLNGLMGFIKKNILMNPEGVFRFNINATMLDLWRTSITNPGVMIKHVPKALGYILETKAPGALTNLYEEGTGREFKLVDEATREFYDTLIGEFEATFGGGFMGWELGNHGQEIMAKHHKGLLELAQNQGPDATNMQKAFQAAKMIGKVYNFMLDMGADVTSARESVMRLAYMADGVTRYDAGKEIEFGAANKKQIKQMLADAENYEGDVKRKKILGAMSLLGNQNYINYNETSKFSQRLKGFIPFISFQEGNLKWHWRLMNNIVSDITARDSSRSRRMRGASKAILGGMMMSGIGQTIWNNIMREFFDAPEDQYIPEYMKNLSYEMPGLGQIDGYILGPGGTIFNKANSTLDLLDYTPLMKKDETYAKHIGNKIFSMSNPLFKTGLGMAQGVNYYDTTPQKRDKQFTTTQHAIQQIGALFGWGNTITNAINIKNGVPTKYYKSATSDERENVAWSFLQQTADKSLRTVEQNEEAAWERLRSKQYDYLKSVGKEKAYDSVNEEYNEVQRLKDAIKKGLRHGDDKYVYENMYALKMELQMAGKSDAQIRNDIKQSLQGMSFLGALSKGDRADFMYRYLNEKEREMLKEAVEWERKMFGPLYDLVYE